uniref:Uncharacterized protein n=1 Tax=Rhizophora mucronata TaxID=61149 RepID=A0A2P2PQX1_RHIMU
MKSLKLTISIHPNNPEMDGKGTYNTQNVKMSSELPALARKIWHAHTSVWILLFLP